MPTTTADRSSVIAAALASLTALSPREPSPLSPRSLYVRGIILGYKR
jgi:hypothetical protein